MVKNTFRDLIYDPALGGGVIAAAPSRRSSPVGSRRPVRSGPAGPTDGQDEVGEKGSMLGSGSVVVLDETSCVVRAAWRITKFFSRSRAASARRVARLGLDRARDVPPRARRWSHGNMTSCLTCATTSRPDSPGAQRPPSACSVLDTVVGAFGDLDVPRRFQGARLHGGVP